MLSEDSEHAAPAWFAPVQQQIDHIVHRINEMDVKLAQVTNRMRGDGSVVPFVIVPFADGTNPTEHPHFLPALTSVAIINGLGEIDATSYLTGYGILPVPHLVADRRARLRIYIGYREP